MSTPSLEVDYLRFVLHEETDGILMTRKRHGALAIETPELRELRELLRIFVDRGIEKIRITGDDPALRSDLIEIVRLLAGFDGVREIAMTTRGIGLAGRVGVLAEEGLQAINFNLDTLQPERFAQMVGTDQFDAIWGALEEALSSGLSVKINAVLCRGTNDDEVDAFVKLATEMPIQVRFVEWNATTDTIASPETFIPTWEVVSMIRQPLTPIERPRYAGPARVFEIPGGQGSIGFIPNVTDHFCVECNRIGLTDFGEITSCIFGRGLSLLGHLRATSGEGRVSAFIDRVLSRKTLLAAKLSGFQPVAIATVAAPPPQ